MPARPEPAARLADYYGGADVRARLLEYCGAPGGSSEPSALGLAAYGGRSRLTEPEGAPVAQGQGWLGLAALLREGADVCRSLADQEGTLLQIDLDYCDPDRPADPYLRPAHCFRRLAPVYEAVLDAFLHYGLRPLVLMTARGYHFTLRALRSGGLYADLVRLGVVGDSLAGSSGAPDATAALQRERAHQGAGKLLEHLCHDVVRRCGPKSTLPVTVADVAPPGRGPFACLDISAYGDPVRSRFARCAFSANQKAWMGGLTPEHPFVIVLPRDGEGHESLLSAREDLRRSAARAERACARIPDVAWAPAWLDAYQRSELGRFHRLFEQGPHAERSAWSYTYDVLDVDALPPCARLPLRHPDPYLLTPLHLRTVVRLFRDLGWHPRSIAELVRSRYERGGTASALWRRYDAQTRALFYTRVLLGCLAAGLEPAGAFTCDTQSARGACPACGCGFDLARLRGPYRPFS